MLNIFTSLKNTAFLILLLATSFYFAQLNVEEMQAVLAHKVEYIALLAIIGMLLAAQFSRSRLVWLIALLLVVYLASNNLLTSFKLTVVPDALMQFWVKIAATISESVSKNTESNRFGLAITPLAILSGMFVLAALSRAKDRAVLTFYSLSRVFLCIALIALAYAYLYVASGVAEYITRLDIRDYPVFVRLYRMFYADLIIYIPSVLCLLVMLKSTFNQPNLTSSIILVTSLFWFAFCYNIIDLPLGYCLIILFISFNLVVLIDSYYLAYRDELTGLPSRRALSQLALSLGRHYTVAMVDIDHFKKFNDTYGHDVGDQVLRLVAAKLNRTRGGAKVFRYGGEEFTVVFSRKDGEHAQKYLDKLRSSIARYQMSIRQQQRKGKSNDKDKRGKTTFSVERVKVTISIGYAERESGQSFESVIKAADQALYRAKEAGRNKVCA